MTFSFNKTEYTIVFAGQIYNIGYLKEELISQNFELETHSDTEILLKSYIYLGESIVSKLNGIFSFAIWNNKSKNIFIARDQLGIMPLYYYKTNDIFIFSTDIKAILKHSLIFNNISIEKYPLNSNTDSHIAKTIFNNIYELLPANSMLYQKGTIYFNQYWKANTKFLMEDIESTYNNVYKLTENALKNQLVSDVPFCLFLSNPYTYKLLVKYALNHCQNKHIRKLNVYVLHCIDSNFQSLEVNLADNINTMFQTDINIIINTIFIDNCSKDSVLDTICKAIKQEYNICIFDTAIDKLFRVNEIYNIKFIQKIFKTARNMRS